MTGAGDEARAASEGLLAAAEATDNPHVASFALLVVGITHRDVDPVAAYDVHRRGLKIAQDSGNRQLESYHTGNLARLAAGHGEPMDALEYITLALRNFYDSGSFTFMPGALAILATFFDRSGHYESAATISARGASPFTQTTYPEFDTTITHLREVLGDDVYESLARVGKNMTNAVIGEIRTRSDRAGPRGTTAHTSRRETALKPTGLGSLRLLGVTRYRRTPTTTAVRGAVSALPSSCASSAGSDSANPVQQPLRCDRPDLLGLRL